MTNQVRDLVAAQTAIPRQNILLNCSHTHSSPSTLPGYHNVPLTPAHRNHLQVLPYIIAGAITEAWHRRQPARIGAASTQVTGITVNRRDPALPVDPQLGVVRIDDAAGRPLACLVNYACHGTSVGPHDLEWTADFAGYVADAVESALPGCAGLFLQGAEGDIHPWDFYFGNAHPRFPDGYEAAERLGKAIAGPAAGLAQQIETVAQAEIAVASTTLMLPPRPIRWTADEAEAYVKQVEAVTPPWTGAVVPADCPACMSAQTYPATYLLSGARHEGRFARNYPTGIPAELTVVRINDIALAANPGELFSELGMRIKAESPIEHTFVLSITNNWMGYIPIRAAAEAVLGFDLPEFLDSVKHRRHYGATTTTEVGPTAGEMLVDETLKLIDSVKVTG